MSEIVVNSTRIAQYFRPDGAGILIEPQRPRLTMLVEGGYLHSMKLLIEKSAQTPDTDDGRNPREDEPRSGAGLVGRSIKRIASLFKN